MFKKFLPKPRTFLLGTLLLIAVVAGSFAIQPAPGYAQDNGGDPNANSVRCETGGAMGWLVCPLIEFFAESTDYIADDVLQPFLEVDPLTTEDEDHNVIYNAWGNIRTVANVMLVPVFLVLIFAQATSFGLDAYSVKKALPRLALAVIGIQLSYFVAAIMIDFFNIVGIGVGDLLLSSFAPEATLGSGDTEVTVSVSGNLGQVFGGYGLLALFGAGGIAWVLSVGVGAAVMSLALLVLIPLFLAILLTFFVLVIRQGIITALVAFAPLAFVAWVLPNTEKWFKQWFELFAKMLFMFPLIMILLASGKLFAAILTADLSEAATADGGGAEGITLFITILAALVAMAAPLFMVPATFKLAGSAMSALGGMASNFRRRGAGGVQGDSRDPNSFRARTTRRRRQNQAGFIAGNRGRFLGGDTDATRNSLRPWKRGRGGAEQVPKMRSKVNQILNAGGARVMDVEGTNAQLMQEARKRAQSYAQTGQEDAMFVASLMGGISRPGSAEGKAQLKERLDQFGKGKLADKSDVVASAKRISSDKFMKRASMEHIASKAKNFDELDTLRRSIALDNSLSPTEKNQTWGGAAYAIKNTNLPAKHMKLDGVGEGEAATFKSGDFLEEASRMSSYQMSLQNEDFWDRMSEIEKGQHQDQLKGDESKAHLKMIEDQVRAQKIKPVGITEEQLQQSGVDVENEEDLQRLLSRGQSSPRSEAALQNFFDTFKRNQSNSQPPADDSSSPSQNTDSGNSNPQNPGGT